jgi:hypothetical protein
VLPVTEYNWGHVTLAISFENHAGQDILVDPTNITVNLVAGKPVKIITAEELAKKARNEAALASLSSSLGGLSRATLGASPTTVTSAGQYGGTGYSSTMTVRNPAQQVRDMQSNNAQAMNEQAAIESSLTAAIDEIHDTVLQKTTLVSGQSIGGKFLLQVPKLKPEDDKTMTVTINFAGDQHVFAFTMDKMKVW